MGLGGISIWQLLIILVIVLLLFGTKKLRGIGSDLGGAVKGFKDSMADKEAESSEATDDDTASIANTDSAAEKTSDEKEKSAS